MSFNTQADLARGHGHRARSGGRKQLGIMTSSWMVTLCPAFCSRLQLHHPKVPTPPLFPPVSLPPPSFRDFPAHRRRPFGTSPLVFFINNYCPLTSPCGNYFVISMDAVASMKTLLSCPGCCLLGPQNFERKTDPGSLVFSLHPWCHV